MQSVNFDNIPEGLKALRSWVVWKIASRREGDKPTKLPFQISGEMAKADDPTTWTSFSSARQAYKQGGYSGVGFEFSESDNFCGVDLDGCRNPETGVVAEWAREIVLKFASYAEVSPSETGVKIFCIGKAPFDRGRKKELEGVEKICDKNPAIEVYDHGRYFAVTGLRLKGMPNEPMDGESSLAWLKEKYFSDSTQKNAPDFRSGDAIFERARKYIAKLDGAISGSDGHGKTFHAACVLVMGFELSESEALTLMHEFNLRCSPAWSERELQHKVKQAFKQSGPRGYLKNSAPENWQRVTVPDYAASLPPEPKKTTLVASSRAYMDSIRNGQPTLFGSSVSDLDYALGGGFEAGEMVIYAARPSHGKSLTALQAIHNWTELGFPCAMVSEEMSPMMLGRRTIQFISRKPQESWVNMAPELDIEIDQYASSRSECYIFESCGRADVAAEKIEEAVEKDGVKCAVIDYAQLLKSPGKSRYDQVTNTSIILRQLANRTKIVLLVLAQLNREIEHRTSFIPCLGDLRESGQLEQDADVVVGLCWPFRTNKEEPVGKYQFHVLKNRNRGTTQSIVECLFIPDRQMITEASFGQFNIESANPPQSQSGGIWN